MKEGLEGARKSSMHNTILTMNPPGCKTSDMLGC